MVAIFLTGFGLLITDGVSVLVFVEMVFSFVSTLSVEDEYVQHSVVAVYELMKKELIQGMENTEKFKKIKAHSDCNSCGYDCSFNSSCKCDVRLR